MAHAPGRSIFSPGFRSVAIECHGAGEIEVDLVGCGQLVRLGLVHEHFHRRRLILQHSISRRKDAICRIRRPRQRNRYSFFILDFVLAAFALCDG